LRGPKKNQVNTPMGSGGKGGLKAHVRAHKKKALSAAHMVVVVVAAAALLASLIHKPGSAVGVNSKLDFCGVLLFLPRGCCSASRKSRIANPVSSSLLRTADAAPSAQIADKKRKKGAKLCKVRERGVCAIAEFIRSESPGLSMVRMRLVQDININQYRLFNVIDGNVVPYNIFFFYGLRGFIVIIRY